MGKLDLDSDEEYVHVDDVIDPNDMERVKRLAREMIVTELELDDLMTKAKKLKKKHDFYAEKLIPDLMLEIGLEDFKLTRGARIILKRDVRGSFPQDEDKQERAFQHLRDTGNDGIIKSQVTLEYGVGTDSVVRTLLDKLEKELSDLTSQAKITAEKTIHHSTLLAFVRRQLQREADPDSMTEEQRAKFKPIQLEDFGVVEYATVKVKT